MFRLSKLLFIIFSFSMAISLLSGCKKDESPDDCENFVSLGGEVTINGAKNSLAAAQLIINSSFDGSIYGLQVGGFTSDCNVLQTFSLFVPVAEGSKLNGTYTIAGFANAEETDAFGSYSEQKISPTSQFLEDIDSGSLKVTDKGSKLYSIDLTAKTISGENVSLKGEVQF